jgi:hypothetical protein
MSRVYLYLHHTHTHTQHDAIKLVDARTTDCHTIVSRHLLLPYDTQPMHPATIPPIHHPPSIHYTACISHYIRHNDHLTSPPHTYTSTCLPACLSIAMHAVLSLGRVTRACRYTHTFSDCFLPLYTPSAWILLTSPPTISLCSCCRGSTILMVYVCDS